MTTTNAFTQTPVLAPGTYSAHRVLREVIRTIEAEPKRLRMKDWVTALQGRPCPDIDLDIDKVDLPACGTAACVSGWIGILTNQQRVHGQQCPRAGSFASWQTLPLLGLGDGASLETPRRNAARNDLSDIFMLTLSETPVVLDRLRAYCVEYRGLLSHLKVVVR